MLIKNREDLTPKESALFTEKFFTKSVRSSPESVIILSVERRVV